MLTESPRDTDNIRYKTQKAPETQTTLDTRHRKPQRHRQHGFLCLVSNVVCVSGAFCVLYLMLFVSLDFLCLVSNVVCVSGAFCVLYLMLFVSLDFLCLVSNVVCVSDTRHRKSRNTDNIRYRTQKAPETQTTLDTRHRKSRNTDNVSGLSVSCI
jgi:Na+/H+ antiporter NhaB